MLASQFIFLGLPHFSTYFMYNNVASVKSCHLLILMSNSKKSSFMMSKKKPTESNSLIRPSPEIKNGHGSYPVAFCLRIDIF